MLISFSKAWGQDEHRWNYPGGDWNYKSMSAFMQFYGIKEAWVTGKDTYYEGDKEIECLEYSGFATKEIERLKKHWVVEYCKPCPVKLNTKDMKTEAIKKLLGDFYNDFANCTSEKQCDEVLEKHSAQFKSLTSPVKQEPTEEAVNREDYLLQGILQNVCIDYTYRWSKGISKPNHKTMQDYIKEIKGVFSSPAPSPHKPNNVIQMEETFNCEACSKPFPLDEARNIDDANFCNSCYKNGVISMYKDFVKLYPKEFNNYRNAMEQGATINDLLEQQKQISPHKPLSEITEEDLNICAKICFGSPNPEYNISPEEVMTGEVIPEHDNVHIEVSTRCFEGMLYIGFDSVIYLIDEEERLQHMNHLGVYQYLQHKGYALPQYFPVNEKTGQESEWVEGRGYYGNNSENHKAYNTANAIDKSRFNKWVEKYFNYYLRHGYNLKIEHNEILPLERRSGFYDLDQLYNLYISLPAKGEEQQTKNK